MSGKAKKALLLGNGISRMSFVDAIESYPGEVWACNYAFREFPKKITRLTGHKEPLTEAQELKEMEGLPLEIWGGPISGGNPAWKKFTVGPKWLRDSGTSFVAQALHEGYEIELCGYDLGGPHMFDPRYYRVDKSNWVKRWAEIAEAWGLDSVTFWGHDHKPYIMDVFKGIRDYKEYARKYRARKPHIDNPEYIEHWRNCMSLQKKEDLKKEEIKMVAVKFSKNGVIVPMREQLANKYISKGKATLVKAPEPPKEEKPKPEKTTEPEKPEKPSMAHGTKKGGAK